MSRKDFQLIAATIRELPGVTESQREVIARRFADKLVFTNDRFDSRRFLAACGVVVS